MIINDPFSKMFCCWISVHLICLFLQRKLIISSEAAGGFNYTEQNTPGKMKVTRKSDQKMFLLQRGHSQLAILPNPEISLFRTKSDLIPPQPITFEDSGCGSFSDVYRSPYNSLLTPSEMIQNIDINDNTDDAKDKNDEDRGLKNIGKILLRGYSQPQLLADKQGAMPPKKFSRENSQNIFKTFLLPITAGSTRSDPDIQVSK